MRRWSAGFSRFRHAPRSKKTDRCAVVPTRRACASEPCSKCSTSRRDAIPRWRHDLPRGSMRDPVPIPRQCGSRIADPNVNDDWRPDVRGLAFCAELAPSGSRHFGGSGRPPGLLAAKRAHASFQRRPRSRGVRKSVHGAEPGHSPGVAAVPRPVDIRADHGRGGCSRNANRFDLISNCAIGVPPRSATDRRTS